MQNDTIPEWAEKAAQDFHNKWETGMSGAAFRGLQRALLAAEQRGRKAGLEEAAKVALTRSPDDDNLDWQVRQQVAATIRSLGEKL